MRVETRRTSPTAGSDPLDPACPKDPVNDSSVWDKCLEGKGGCPESDPHLVLPLRATRTQA